MAVEIHTTDGKRVLVKGSLGEVQQRLIAQWATLAEFELDDRDGRVYVSTPQITHVIEPVPGTVVLDGS
jgi:hypothetical protein